MREFESHLHCQKDETDTETDIVGENSTRSSMYARVGDVAAPTPPPVDLLRNLGSVPSPGWSDSVGHSFETARIT